MAHFCISNPCYICYPELNKSEIIFFSLPTEEDAKIWKMKYKDVDSDDAPWTYWESTDRPSEVLIEALKKEGMFRLQVI